jgi:hypothetical protein
VELVLLPSALPQDIRQCSATADILKGPRIERVTHQMKEGMRLMARLVLSAEGRRATLKPAHQVARDLATA